MAFGTAHPECRMIQPPFTRIPYQPTKKPLTIIWQGAWGEDLPHPVKCELMIRRPRGGLGWHASREADELEGVRTRIPVQIIAIPEEALGG